MGRIHIVSRSSQPFLDRREAGRQLAAELQKLKTLKPAVLGIPRGGVPVAAEAAQALGGDLDVILTHKIGAPGQAELAIGSVTETGKMFVDKRFIGLADSAYLRDEKRRQMELLSRRLSDYRKVLPRVPLKNRHVVVVDDGIATGFTMEAALWAAAQEEPASLTAAVPVAPEETVRRIARHADQTVCLRAPESFAAVGQFYADFRPVEDEELANIFKKEAEKNAQRHAA